MKASAVLRIEQLAELSASAALGSAVGFAVYGLLLPFTPQPALGAYVAALAGVSYLSSRRLLSAVSPEPSEARAAGVPQAMPAPELLLDDLFITESTQTHVVGLFDPARRARIGGPTPDATQDLHAALNELRRSLR